MNNPDTLTSELAAFEKLVDELVVTMHRLGEENRGLRISQQQLSNERAGLMARNEQARSRVEAMIQRLKSLEDNA